MAVPRWVHLHPSDILRRAYGLTSAYGDSLPAARAPPIPLPTSGIALDLGCGAGRDSVLLAMQGLHVTGVDISPVAVDYANTFTQEFREAYEAHEAHEAHEAQRSEAGPEEGFVDRLQFVAYDALLLPRPLVEIDLIWDNTVYCNLRYRVISGVDGLVDWLSG